MANMELITSVTVGSGGAASVTLPATGTIPQTYIDLKVMVSARTTRSSVGSYFYISFNGSSSNFSSKFVGGDGASASSGSVAQLAGIETDANATASTFDNTEIYIPNYTSTTAAKSYSVDSVSENNATTGFNYLVAGLWNPGTQAAITSITLTSESGGSFISGSTFYLYGISNVTSGSKATGGIVSSDGTYWYHMFPFSGTFTPTAAISADVLLVAGGSGGGVYVGGGGGAGGIAYQSNRSLSATSYSIAVGAGGAGLSGSYSGSGGTGTNSTFDTITASAGTASGSYADGGRCGTGSNGTSGGATTYGTAGGGTMVGGGGNYPAGGGGGAGAAGGIGYRSTGIGGSGGIGLNTWSSWATATQTGADGGYYAGGGGGGGDVAPNPPGGLGGGGAGKNGSGTASNAIINTGGGGGGVREVNSTSGSGGSGLVIIRYAI
jgi:hypothetical protein